MTDYDATIKECILLQHRAKVGDDSPVLGEVALVDVEETWEKAEDSCLDTNFPLCACTRRVKIKSDLSDTKRRRDADEGRNLVGWRELYSGKGCDLCRSRAGRRCYSWNSGLSCRFVQLTGTTHTFDSSRGGQQGDKELDDGKDFHVCASNILSQVEIFLFIR